MRIIGAGEITELTARLCIEANRNLPADVEARLLEFRRRETWPAARDVLDQLVENLGVARERGLPICQDTGMACVFLEIGREVHVEGDIYEAVDGGVRRACREGFLRASVVTDPLERRNSGDNSPALVYVDFAAGDRLRITVAPKGFGSENMSRVGMLNPAAGIEGITDFVLSAVREAGANPCPPIVAGIGIGGNFDRAALLAKKALIRPLDRRNPQRRYAEMEEALLEKINDLGIGPQGFGGMTTCLAVSIETAPTHIAGLPCAVNINCHASRHAEGFL